VKELESVVAPVVEAAGLELVEVLFRGGRGGVLRVTVDREGGVDLEAIAEVSERISRRLDLEGFNPGPYTLEVSSPGVERPLRGPEEFARHVGSTVQVRTHREGQQRTFTGTILGTDQDAVTIATEGGVETVQFDDVASARTVLDWPRTSKKGER
jgi:ribosome maturation factor RimP